MTQGKLTATDSDLIQSVGIDDNYVATCFEPRFVGDELQSESFLKYCHCWSLQVGLATCIYPSSDDYKICTQNLIVDLVK